MRVDLGPAVANVAALQDLNAPPVIVAFSMHPSAGGVTLQAVAKHGPGSKVSREKTLAWLAGAGATGSRAGTLVAIGWGME